MKRPPMSLIAAAIYVAVGCNRTPPDLLFQPCGQSNDNNNGKKGNYECATTGYVAPANSGHVATITLYITADNEAHAEAIVATWFPRQVGNETWLLVSAHCFQTFMDLDNSICEDGNGTWVNGTTGGGGGDVGFPSYGGGPGYGGDPNIGSDVGGSSDVGGVGPAGGTGADPTTADTGAGAGEGMRRWFTR